MLLKMLLAFSTALFTGITLRTPPATWLFVGLTGMLAWLGNATILRYHIPDLVAAVTGALIVGLMAEILARIQKQPVTVYIVSGIIPLVPGVTTYNAMLAFLEKNYMTGLILGFKAFLIATYLAAGLAIVPIIVRYTRMSVYRANQILELNNILRKK